MYEKVCKNGGTARRRFPDVPEKKSWRDQNDPPPTTAKVKFAGAGSIGHEFDWGWSWLDFVFLGLDWAGLRILKPVPNTSIMEK